MDNVKLIAAVRAWHKAMNHYYGAITSSAVTPDQLTKAEEDFREAEFTLDQVYVDLYGTMTLPGEEEQNSPH